MTSRVLILRHDHHDFGACADVIAAALAKQDGMEVTVTETESSLTDGTLGRHDVLVIGSGLTHRVGAPGAPGTYYAPALTGDQTQALLEFVAAGGGFIGLHITGWYIGGELVKMLGGSANIHPPAEQTTRYAVRIAAADHEITRDVADFVLRDDELYIPSWGPDVTVLATAQWSDRPVALMWASTYGQGRVFYSSAGHLPVTYENPSVQRILANASRWCAHDDAA